MNVNLSGIMPGQFGLMPKNMGAVNTKENSFVNLLDSLMIENSPANLLAATTVDNPDVSGSTVDLLQMIGKGMDLNIAPEAVTALYEQPGLKENTLEQDKKDTDDELMVPIEVIGQYLNYMPKYENESYEVLNTDDNVKILNDLIYGSKQKPDNFQSLKMQEQINPVQEKVSVDSPQAEFIKEISTYAEKLITQIENSRNKLKDEIDLNANMAQNNRLMFSENKIIQVSDESSYIKSSAISQIKEKIELMVSEGTNGTKEVTMELQPENLGKVNIKMFYEDKKLTVEIKALNEETSKLLMSNTQELAKVLNKTVDSNVNVVVKHDSTYAENPLDYNQDKGQNQQKNNYTYSGNNQDDNDDDMFSQIMNSTAS